MNRAGEPSAGAGCRTCGVTVEVCAFCESYGCRVSLCYRCVRVALGQEVGQPHGHGG